MQQRGAARNDLEQVRYVVGTSVGDPRQRPPVSGADDISWAGAGQNLRLVYSNISVLKYQKVFG